MKKNQYLSTTLDGFLNESKTFMLKRGYGKRKPVVVGAKGNIRDQVLPYVNENRRVSQKVLKSFIAGLNEGSRNPGAAANMWIKRNKKYFVTESRNGVTYFKLSKIGSRLINRIKPMFEKKEYDFIDKKKGYDRPGITSNQNEKCDECGKTAKKCKCNDMMDEADGAGQEIKNSKIEKYLASKKKRMHKKSEWANLLEGDDEIEEEDGVLEESIRKSKMTKLLESIENNKLRRKLNEEEDEEAEEDELTFDDLDLGDEGDEEGGDDDLDIEDEVEDSDEGVENVEIAEFILTVDDPEAAIAELEEIGIEAELVSDDGDEEDLDLEGDEEDLGLEGDEEDLDLEGDEAGDEDLDLEGDEDLDLEEADETDEDVADDLDFDLKREEGDENLDLELGDEESEDEVEFDDVDMEDEEEEGQKIKVGAEHAEKLVKWLEEKGVDIEDMFGGELEIEGEEDEDLEDEDLEDEDLEDEDLDLENDEEDEDEDEDEEDKE